MQSDHLDIQSKNLVCQPYGQNITYIANQVTPEKEEAAQNGISWGGKCILDRPFPPQKYKFHLLESAR